MINHIQSPIISVIIPAYNHELFVADAIRSVLNQSFTDFEIIAIDDGSTDNTFDEIQKFDDSRIRSAQQANRGAAETINLGVEMSMGKYITILNSDDMYHSERLLLFKQYMDRHPETMVLSSLVQPVDRLGNPLKAGSGNAFHDYWLEWYQAAVQNVQQDGDLFFSLLQSNYVVSTSNIFVDATIFQEGIRFPDLSYCHDYAFLLQVLPSHPFGFIHKNLLKYRLHGANTIRDNHFIKRLEVQYAVCHSLDFCEIFSGSIGLQRKMSGIVYRGLEKNPDINHDIRLAEKDRLIKKSEGWFKDLQTKYLLAEQRLMLMEGRIESLHTLVAEKDARIRERDGHLRRLAEENRQKDGPLTHISEEISVRDNQLCALAEEIRQKDAQLHASTEEIRQKDAQLHTSTEEIRQKDAQLHASTEEIRQKDAQLHAIAEEIRQKDDQLHALAEEINGKNACIHDIEQRFETSKSAYHAYCLEQEAEQARQSEHVVSLKTQIHRTEMQLQDADRKILSVEQALAEKDRLLAEKENFLQEIFASKGWQTLTRYRNFKHSLFGRPEPTVDEPPVLTDEKTYLAEVHHPLNPNRPKVVHAIANFLTGGSSRLVVDLVEHLGHKFDQEVISFCIPSPLAYSGVQLHDFSGDVAIERIETFIREKNPQILHVHYWGEGDAPWYRKVFTAAEIWPGILIENVNTPVVPFVSDRIDHYVYVSEYAKNFAACEADKSTVIYPGSNLAMFDRNEAPIPDNVIGMVYRLDSDKLREDAIQVFIQVVKKRPRTRVLIVGGGEFFDAYRTQVAEAGASANFEFTGYVPYYNLPDYYRQMSIFVAPVWKESFGQVSPFAMSMQIPVAGYRVGALPEILGNEDLLGSNIDELSDIIVHLLEDRDRRMEIGRFNHQRVHKQFSVEAMVAEYDVLYERLIQDRAR
jgi:glycosyltransferase involved in cell wall biosynthesis